MNGVKLAPWRLTHCSCARYFCRRQTAAGSQLSSSCGTQSPRSSTRTLASCPARARAIVPPPAPLPTMTTSKCGSATGHLLHQHVVGPGALETHLGLSAGADGRGEVPVHRLVAADVAPGRGDDPRHGTAADHDRCAVGLEGDDAPPAVELRDPQPA